MNGNEALIQNEICNVLQESGIFFHSVPNEGAGRDKIRQMKLIGMGLRAGVADLVIWVPLPDGVRIEYWEVKTGKGRQNSSQKKFEGLCRYCGIPYRIIRSAAEAAAAVRGLHEEIGDWPDFRQIWRNLDENGMDSE